MSGTTTIPNDPNPALRADLHAKLVIVVPQIRGLRNLAAMPVSAGLLAQINEQITDRVNRQQLIQNVLDGLDAVVREYALLLDDGYPALPPTTIQGSLFSELQGDNSDLEAAVSVFVADQITAGTPTFSPNPNPPTEPGP